MSMDPASPGARLALIDIDGVLADDTHRLHHAMRGDWGQYFDPDQLARDGLLSPGADLYERAIVEYDEVRFFTGRREDIFEPTRRWLDRHALLHPLIMRPRGNGRPLSAFKADYIAEELTRSGYARITLWDDDVKVVDAVNDLALPGVQAHLCTWYDKSDKLLRAART